MEGEENGKGETVRTVRGSEGILWKNGKDKGGRMPRKIGKVRAGECHGR